MAGSVTSFADSVNFFALAGYHVQSHDLDVFECFFQRKARKRVSEWREVTFMKEWVNPCTYIGYLQALDLPQNLFPFPRTGHMKTSLGPTPFILQNLRQIGNLQQDREGWWTSYLVHCDWWWQDQSEA